MSRLRTLIRIFSLLFCVTILLLGVIYANAEWNLLIYLQIYSIYMQLHAAHAENWQSPDIY
jgi:hypothetical protein